MLDIKSSLDVESGNYNFKRNMFFLLRTIPSLDLWICQN